MTDSTFLELLAEEERQFKKFAVAGTDRVQVAGNLRTGLAINIQPRGEEDVVVGGACCLPDGSCIRTTEEHCADAGGTYQGNGVQCGDPNPCSTCPPANPCTVDINHLSSPHLTDQSISGKPVCCAPITDADGWRADDWNSGFANDCSDGSSGTCTAQMVWDHFIDEGWSLLFTLNKLAGDGVLADGWYIKFYLEDSTCSYQSDCVFLGTDDTVFATDLNLIVPMPSTFGGCSDASIELTFHPCP